MKDSADAMFLRQVKHVEGVEIGSESFMTRGRVSARDPKKEPRAKIS